MGIWTIFTLTAVALVLAEVALARLMTLLPPALQNGLVALALPAMLALVLVAYFNWRARVKRRLLADAERGTWRTAAEPGGTILD